MQGSLSSLKMEGIRHPVSMPMASLLTAVEPEKRLGRHAPLLVLAGLRRKHAAG
jgi:hypothetical protein